MSERRPTPQGFSKESGEGVHRPLSPEEQMESIESIQAPGIIPKLPEEYDGKAQPEKVSLFPKRRRRRDVEVMEYSKPFADLICSMLSEGWLLSKVCELPGMPSVQTVMKWKHTKADFKEELKRAYEARAEVMIDKAVEIADQSTWKSVKADTLKVETAKYVAEKSDPERFGNKKNDQGNTFNFFISTGFEGKGDPIPVQIDKRDPALVLKERDEKE